MDFQIRKGMKVRMYNNKRKRFCSKSMRIMSQQTMREPYCTNLAGPMKSRTMMIHM